MTGKQRQEFGEKKGRYLERQRCARVLKDYIKAYPASLFPPSGKSVEAIRGTTLRTMLPVILADIEDPNRLA